MAIDVLNNISARYGWGKWSSSYNPYFFIYRDIS